MIHSGSSGRGQFGGLGVIRQVDMKRTSGSNLPERHGCLVESRGIHNQEYMVKLCDRSEHRCSCTYADRLEEKLASGDAECEPARRQGKEGFRKTIRKKLSERHTFPGETCNLPCTLLFWAKVHA